MIEYLQFLQTFCCGDSDKKKKTEKKSLIRQNENEHLKLGIDVQEEIEPVELTEQDLKNQKILEEMARESKQSSKMSVKSSSTQSSDSSQQEKREESKMSNSTLSNLSNTQPEPEIIDLDSTHVHEISDDELDDQKLYKTVTSGDSLE